MQNKRVTPTPERRAILEDLKWALAGRGSYQQQLLPFIGGVLRQCRDLDLSPADIEQIVENWQRDQESDCPASEDESRVQEMFRDQIVNMCLRLQDHPFEKVQAVIDDQCSKLARARRDANTLEVLEEPVRGVYDGLDDRTRYIMGVAIRLARRSVGASYWGDIRKKLANATFLKEKSADFADDPQIGVLVKAFRMGEAVSAVDM